MKDMQERARRGVIDVHVSREPMSGAWFPSLRQSIQRQLGLAEGQGGEWTEQADDKLLQVLR